MLKRLIFGNFKDGKDAINGSGIFGFNNNKECALGRWMRGKVRCSCQEPYRVQELLLVFKNLSVHGRLSVENS